MPSVSAETTINRPIEEVFQYVSDPRNEVQWVSAVREFVEVSDTPVRVGSTYRNKATFMGRHLENTVEVTEYEPNRAYGYHVVKGPVHAVRHFRLEEANGGTRVTLTLSSEDLSFMRLAETVLQRAAQRHEQHALETLKDLLEVHGPDHPR